MPDDLTFTDAPWGVVRERVRGRIERIKAVYPDVEVAEMDYGRSISVRRPCRAKEYRLQRVFRRTDPDECYGVMEDMGRDLSGSYLAAYEAACRRMTA